MRSDLTESEKHLYGTWIEMRARCKRVTKDSYARYGGAEELQFARNGLIGQRSNNGLKATGMQMD